MFGMIQIITYLLAFYLIIKRLEILIISLAASGERRGGIILLAIFVLIACIIAACGFVFLQEQHVMSLKKRLEKFPADHYRGHSGGCPGGLINQKR